MLRMNMENPFRLMPVRLAVAQDPDDPSISPAQESADQGPLRVAVDPARDVLRKRPILWQSDGVLPRTWPALGCALFALGVVGFVVLLGLGSALFQLGLPNELYRTQAACAAGGVGVWLYAGRALKDRSMRDAAPTLTFLGVLLAGSYLSASIDLDFHNSDFYPTASQVLAAALIGLVIEAALIHRGQLRASKTTSRYRMQGLIFIGVGLASALVALIPIDGAVFETIVEASLLPLVLGGLSASLVAILLLAGEVVGGADDWR